MTEVPQGHSHNMLPFSSPSPSESLVCEVDETWEQAQMDAGNRSTFYKNLARSGDMGKQTILWGLLDVKTASNSNWN